VLFFLDAHADPALFDGTVPSSAERHSPVRDEIRQMRTHRDISDDVIIVDDQHLVCKDWSQGVSEAKHFIQSYATLNELRVDFPEHTLEVVNPSDYAAVLRPKKKNA